MSPEAQRIAIAKVCGIQVIFWKALYNNNGRVDFEVFKTKKEAEDYIFNGKGVASFINFSAIPDYLNDLNAMHEAEKTLHAMENWEMCNYENRLNTMTSNWSWSATAAQRAEAFLKTFNLWEEGE